MSKFLIITLSIILLAILGYFCIYKHSPIIQSDIETRTNVALAEQDLDHVNVGVDGRDIILSGIVENQTVKQQAEDYIKNVYGVRSIDNQLTISTTESVTKHETKPEPEIKPEPQIEAEAETVPVKKIVQPPKLDALPEFTCQQEFDFLLDNRQINFATNSADIDTSSTSLLSDLIDIVNQCPDANIEIAGHTDSRGSDDFNLRLSQARASSVMNYLINNEIEPNRLTAVGYGESNPIADNDSTEGLAKNRRIEFNIKGLSE
jgi:outer membrane protein OmpA-like peptidoglycan-associated protein